MNYQARNFSATVPPEQQAGRQATAQRSTKLAPDCAGLNFFAIDHNAKSVMPHYIDDALLTHILPYLDSLGALCGGKLLELADTSERNPPVLRQRDRFGGVASAAQEAEGEVADLDDVAGQIGRAHV